MTAPAHDPRHHLLHECEAIDRYIEGALRSAHLSAGLIPDDTHRGLFPWEIESHTNFAGIDNDVQSAAAAIARQLQAQRAQFTRLLIDDLQATAAQAGPSAPDVAVAERTIAIDALLGLQAVSGVPNLLSGAEDDLRQILHGTADAGAQRLRVEAAAQGVQIARDAPLPLTAEQQARIDLAARRLATGPNVDLVRALREAAYRIPDAGGRLVDLLARTAQQLATSPLDRYARTSAQQVYGTGRQAAVGSLPDAQRIYASELLDHNTCLSPWTMVTTAAGRKRADEITTADELLTHAGRFVTPARIVVSEIEDELVSVRFADRTLAVTANHPVFCLTAEGFAWVEAGQLAVGALVASQKSVELPAESRLADLGLGETPDVVAAANDVLRLTRVGCRSQLVPVGAVAFDHQSADHEVHHPWPDLGLGLEPNALAGQEGTNPGLDARLGAGRDITAPRAVTPSAFAGRDDAEWLVAVGAFDDNGRAAARFAAIGPPHGAIADAVSKPFSAAAALVGTGPVIHRALPRAVVVADGIGNRNLESHSAADAHLRDTVERPAGVAGFVRNPALMGAVFGTSTGSAANLLPTCETEAGRLGGSVSCPSKQSGTLGAADSTAPDAAVDTRSVHNVIVLERVEEISRNPYAGRVFDFQVPPDASLFAEGVLVHNCGPCSLIDGTEYGTLADAQDDYPGGTYKDCEGADLCRGTLVFVWGGESPPSVGQQPAMPGEPDVAA